MPFLCEVTEDVAASGVDAIIFKSKIRNDTNQLAPHIVGYCLDGNGVYGIEKSYSDFFENNSLCALITLSVPPLEYI